MVQEWADVFKRHIEKSAAFWVRSEISGYQPLSDEERSSLLRKKEELKNRGAEILKTDVSVLPVRIQEEAAKSHVVYLLKKRHLIGQKDACYVEETIDKRQINIEDNQVRSDAAFVDKKKKDRGPVETPLIPLSHRMKGKGKPGVGGPDYQRLEAVKYAERWWDSFNPGFPSFDVDCTNFVSQCLHSGGIPMHGAFNTHKGWWCRNKQWSLSWTVAHSLRWQLSGSSHFQAVECSKPDELMPGDVICYDFEGDGRFDHTVIVTAKDAKGMPLVNAHTSPCRNRYWSYTDSTAWTKAIKYKFFHIDTD